MDNKDLKKLLAGMSLVALLGSSGLALSGCATTRCADVNGQNDGSIDASNCENTDTNSSA